jgi:glycosyltransferase involved in cell wall biosynthesis
MIFSIIIPTFKNFEYLKYTIDSIKKNSFKEHEIIIHVNGHDENTENYLKQNNLKYSSSKNNLGLCSGVNVASKLSTNDYILYSHDDMYFLPKWDFFLIEEVKKINHNKFYLSMTQISHTKAVKGNLQHIHFDCGSSLENFDPNKLLKNYDKFNFRDLQGSHWAPHLVHRSIWDKIGGFSEEFNPGFASDPDFNMKLWLEGVRIFKGISKSRVYHFGSITTRKNEKIVKNDGKNTFLLKWKLTVEFFVKHYLRRGGQFDGPLKEPNKNINYFIDYIISKLKYFFVKFFK